MIFHPDGRLEGTPEEIAQYRKMEKEQAMADFKEWSKQWTSGATPPIFHTYITCSTKGDKTVDPQLALSQFLREINYKGGVNYV